MRDGAKNKYGWLPLNGLGSRDPGAVVVHIPVMGPGVSVGDPPS